MFGFSKANSDHSHRVNLSHPIVVAVIDTGVDLQNQKLTQYLWRNQGEDGFDQFGHLKESNGIDDDRNGYIDDIHGWNFYDQDSNLDDQVGHGSHIAGIITGQSQVENSTDNVNVQIMILKYFSTGKRKIDTQKSSNQALAYALKMGAHVVNYSGGGQTSDPTEKDLFTRLDQKQIWSVVAAGNLSDNLETNDYFPAKYQLPSMIVVGSMDREQKLSTFSNFGSNFVDLFAIGEGILSYGSHGQKLVMSGTSQATALVTRFVLKISQISKQKINKHDLMSQLNSILQLQQRPSVVAFKLRESIIPLKHQVIAGEKEISTRPQARLNL